MNKLFSLLALSFLLLTSNVFGQNYVFNGHIADEVSKNPLESATIYVSDEATSEMINYTISDKNGKFALNIKKHDKPVVFKISIMGFEDYVLNLKSVLAAKDFGNIMMKLESKLLGEVVIKREAPPIRIKKDTLEFNASSFKVRPDSNVQTLLKQLPGVEITSDGKITVNGKEVNQILVNGKPFFDKDGKVALQNLPSELINKVQVSDTKTKGEEVSGEVSTSNNASINLTIDEDKNKGLFGKFTAGYGSDKRYEGSGLVNYFKNKRKISVLMASNNINSTGFSMDEIFDSMGGGRNSSFVYGSGNGSYGIYDVVNGDKTGITRSNLAGLSYSDELFKNFENTANYFFSNTINENTNAARQVNFLPDGTFTTTSGFKSKTDRFSHNLNLDLTYKIDSTTTLSIIPRFYKANSKSTTNSVQQALDSNNQFLNGAQASKNNDTDINSFNNELYFNKQFRKKGRNLNVNFNNANQRQDNNNLNKSVTSFSDKPDDVRNQTIGNRNLTDKYSTEIQYVEPIKDSLKVFVGTKFESEKMSNDVNTFDYNPADQKYSSKNDLQTYFMSSNTLKWYPKAGVMVERKKFYGNLSGGTSVFDFDNHSLYLNQSTDLNKKYMYPLFNVYAKYQFTKTKRISLNYANDVMMPRSAQVLPVANFSNPLNTVVGNPDLMPGRYHQLHLNYGDYDYSARSGYGFYTGGNFIPTWTTDFTTYDESKKSVTTYKNVSDTYNSWAGAYWNKTIKHDAHSYRLGFNFWNNYDLSKGFTNGTLYEARVLRINPSVNFTYDYGELLSVTPSYNFNYNNTNYTNYTVDKTSNFVHALNVQMTNYWPKNWTFGNDLGYTYNSNISAGFKKDFYLWNTSVAYSFYNKMFTAKVKVYDVLNQNQSVTRTITPTTVLDQQNTVLKRYVMFSLTYKFDKFGSKGDSNK